MQDEPGQWYNNCTLKLKEEIPRMVRAEYASGGEQRNNSRRNEEA